MIRTLEEARAHRYRNWAGNPGGQSYRERYCVATVADGGRSVLSHQCGRKLGYGPAQLYCHQHAKQLEARS